MVSNQNQDDLNSYHKKKKKDDSENEKTADFGSMAMYCGTLPSIYVRIAISQPENSSVRLLKAVTIKSPISSTKIEEVKALAKASFLGEIPVHGYLIYHHSLILFISMIAFESLLKGRKEEDYKL